MPDWDFVPRVCECGEELFIEVKRIVPNIKKSTEERKGSGEAEAKE